MARAHDAYRPSLRYKRGSKNTCWYFDWSAQNMLNFGFSNKGEVNLSSNKLVMSTTEWSVLYIVKWFDASWDWLQS